MLLLHRIPLRVCYSHSCVSPINRSLTRDLTSRAHSPHRFEHLIAGVNTLAATSAFEMIKIIGAIELEAHRKTAKGG